MRKGWGCGSFSRRFIIIGWRNGEGESAEQTKCEALPASVSVREEGVRSSLETEVVKGEGAAKVERGQQQPDHALHATVPCPAYGGGALPAGPLRQPGKANLGALPFFRGPPGTRGWAGAGSAARRPPGCGRGQRAQGPAGRPSEQLLCVAHSLRCRRGAERRVVGQAKKGQPPLRARRAVVARADPRLAGRDGAVSPGGAAWGDGRTAGDK